MSGNLEVRDFMGWSQKGMQNIINNGEQTRFYYKRLN